MAGELHQRLIDFAAKWLAKKHAVVITDMVSAGLETPDAIGFSGYYGSTLIECKASRSDFLADRKKQHRGTRGGMGDKRYYMAPESLLRAEEMPDDWGLLELDTEGKIKVTRAADRILNTNHEAERGLLISAIRRIGQNAPTGVSIKCYTIETKRGATMGIEPAGLGEGASPEPSNPPRSLEGAEQ